MNRFSSALILSIALLSSSCLAEPSGGLQVQRVTLDPADPGRDRFGPLEFRGGLRLSGDDGFGGWSGMRLDGGTLTVVNDKGRWMRLELRHSAGRLDDAALLDDGRLRQPNGKGLDDDKTWHDAEGLAQWRGGLVASFERRHRLWHYVPDITAAPVPLDGPAGLARLGPNRGVEAVTDLADGRLLLLAEEGGDAWIGRPGAWDRLTWEVTEDYSPTDAIRLPGGDVLVLERRFSVLSGVGIRLSKLPAAALTPGALLRGEEVLRLAPPLLVDNFEALAIGTASDGRALVYILSDDNFSALQSTLLLAFALPE